MAALDLGSSSVASTDVPPRSWEVFLNFRGKDTGNSFIGFLHKALVDRGITVYLDRQRLETGEPVGPSVREAVEGCKIFIPSFSEHYADCKWCLWELSLIVQRYISNRQFIIPIFFHIRTKDVRHPTESFKAAFDEYMESHKPDVNSWRKAMEVVGKLSGVTIHHNE
ncbi:hypothetical protein NE237_002618 [Protea cynaroides]|uniref:ADP-ribosyl cyclase/cyclic ADP-ribose hydrolase n=1 Tax=Protea cynaroides TaxID=273540 RepID=A0A9Q0KVB7_9MAGN|nr:hypothetical protein NE237_002618 [Protea cynaroides]